MSTAQNTLRDRLLGKVLKLNVEEKEMTRMTETSTRIRKVKLYSLDLSDAITKEAVDFLNNSGLAYRLVLPEKGVTMEMNSFRTTIFVDEGGVITHVGFN